MRSLKGLGCVALVAATLGGCLEFDEHYKGGAGTVHVRSVLTLDTTRIDSKETGIDPVPYESLDEWDMCEDVRGAEEESAELRRLLDGDHAAMRILGIERTRMERDPRTGKIECEWEVGPLVLEDMNWWAFARSYGEVERRDGAYRVRNPGNSFEEYVGQMEETLRREIPEEIGDEVVEKLFQALMDVIVYRIHLYGTARPEPGQPGWVKHEEGWTWRGSLSEAGKERPAFRVPVAGS